MVTFPSDLGDVADMVGYGDGSGVVSSVDVTEETQGSLQVKLTVEYRFEKPVLCGAYSADWLIGTPLKYRLPACETLGLGKVEVKLRQRYTLCAVPTVADEHQPEETTQSQY